MDDANRLSESREKAQYGNNRMEEITEKKLLTLNLKKTCFLLAGGKQAVKKLRRDIEMNPLTIFGEKLKK